MMSDSGESAESDVDGHFMEQVSQRSSESGESDVDGDWGWPSENDSVSPTVSPPVSRISRSEGNDYCEGEGEGEVFVVDVEVEMERDCMVPLTQTWSWTDEVSGDVQALIFEDCEA